MKTSEIFAGMRERVFKVGHAKHALKLQSGEECLNGLAWTVSKLDRELFAPARDIMIAVAKRRGFPQRCSNRLPHIDFNDAPATTFNDIVGFIDECEVVAKEREAR